MERSGPLGLEDRPCGLKERWPRGPALRALRTEAKTMRTSEQRRFVFPFEKLEVWQLAIYLADFVLALLESLPPHRHTRLIGQMEAAVSSIAQNTRPVK